MNANMRAAMLMVLGMALFAIEDLFLKLLSGHLPVPQLLAMFGLLGWLLFSLLLRRRGRRFWTRDLLLLPVILRTLGELIGGFGFVAALALTDLSSTSAILQALPLALVLGGALFLGEQVGWRRWLSVLLGFAGVLMILRPGSDAFQPASLLALIGVAGLTLRDLVTRLVPAHVPSDQLSAAAYAMFVPGGVVLTLMGGQPVLIPEGGQLAQLVCAALIGGAGYAAMVAATRAGQASVIAPFRYARLVFALLIAAVVLGERPDGWTLAGAGLIAVAGAYAMWREARLGRRNARTSGIGLQRGPQP
ncbi:DMT family transporter [Paracoccus sp. M683]|uniref:DMT family transporter n=1 Tax=Paracoccus sp. M683 TaxID=2594268 RepID=UPI00117BE8A6|nr:DMT family transporter [Paracoccus sp. M683]TRW98386.1 DMT family transporter [Paracoccus sp. M683]